MIEPDSPPLSQKTQMIYPPKQTGWLRWLPGGGWNNGNWTNVIMPVIALATSYLASIARITRSSMLEVLGSNYIRTARALGASFPEALVKHGIRNGAVPVVSILGIELATSFLGAVVVEKVYALPGLGSMLLLAIQQRDYPNVQGVLFISTLLVLVIGFCADLLQRAIDPRLRGRRSEA